MTSTALARTEKDAWELLFKPIFLKDSFFFIYAIEQRAIVCVFP